MKGSDKNSKFIMQNDWIYDNSIPDEVREARQLNHWLRGKCLPLWMPDLCCPDYSCCEPELLAPLEERELYVEARNDGEVETVERLDAMFLGRLIESKYLPARGEQP